MILWVPPPSGRWRRNGTGPRFSRHGLRAARWQGAYARPRKLTNPHRENESRGIPFDAKRELRIFYKGEPIEKTYIPDLHCYGKIIVEIKAVEALTKEHRGQLMNYLRLTGSKLGLLVNFAAYPKAVVEQWAN